MDIKIYSPENKPLLSMTEQTAIVEQQSEQNEMFSFALRERNWPSEGFIYLDAVCQ